jgi:DNA polymerase-4
VDGIVSWPGEESSITSRPARRLRTSPSVLHADVDAFYAAVEQRDKPSLRGHPVIVGGLGPRGVVATASYEARRYGVRSAMSMVEARARCPQAAFLAPRFAVYRAVSAQIMDIFAEFSALVEPLSLDEAYLDIATSAHEPISTEAAVEIARRIKEKVRAVTGLSISVGAGNSKLVAKIASDLDKPDGLRVVPAGAEADFLAPLPVTRIPGVGPATAARLHNVGVHTIGELAALSEEEAANLLGRAHGRHLWALAHGWDDRAVCADRAAKSVSVEDTFDQDIADPGRLRIVVRAMAERVVERLRAHTLSGRTISVKVRLADFTTLTRSATLPAPTDDVRVVRRLAERLLTEVDTSSGVRLIGVGISGLTDWVQLNLFADDRGGRPTGGAGEVSTGTPGTASPMHTDLPASAVAWTPGQDVVHRRYGPGWVQGSGRGWVTVRFETRDTPVGPVRSFRDADPELHPAESP